MYRYKHYRIRICTQPGLYCDARRLHQPTEIKSHLLLPTSTPSRKDATTAKPISRDPSSWRRCRNTVAMVTGWRGGWRWLLAGDDHVAVVSLAAEYAPRSNDPAVCVECRTTATQTPSGDSKTHCHVVVVRHPPSMRTIRSKPCHESTFNFVAAKPSARGALHLKPESPLPSVTLNKNKQIFAV